MTFLSYFNASFLRFRPWQTLLALIAMLIFMLFPAVFVYAGSQTFTSSGTFTVPTYDSLTVTVNGAGGGAGESMDSSQGTYETCTTGGTGVSGGQSIFSAPTSVIGNGGSGGTGAVKCTSGGGEVSITPGTTGAHGTASGGDTNTTGGGGAGGTSQGYANGGTGGSGGKAVKTYASGQLSGTISVTVGTGGSYYSAAGTNGSVSITWTVPPDVTFTKDMTIRGTLSVTSDVSKGSGSFVIDHPLDPQNKLLYHSFVESPYAMNMYDGVAEFDTKGEAAVALPGYFEALNKDFRYQLKPIGEPMSNLFVKEEVQKNEFVIGGGVPGGRVSWQVTGIRHDPYILAHPIVPEVEKGSDQLVDKGKYLFPEGYDRSLFVPIISVLRNLWTAFTAMNGWAR